MTKELDTLKVEDGLAQAEDLTLSDGKIPKLATGILPLRLNNVSYTLGDKAGIRDLTLDLTAGTRTVILGANGAGKSLLLRLCHGLLTPTAGKVQWMGAERQGITDTIVIAQRQAMVFQNPIMLRRSVYANIDYPLAIHGFEKEAREDRIISVLEKTGLLELKDRSARVLSGGEQQRLAMARSWALDPEILFLDEATSSLDPASVRRIEDLIETISLSGAKIVMTTHDLNQAQRIADDIVFLHDGELVERSSAVDFFKGPKTREASAFLKGDLVI
jgi:tungstate transport system ATP-binding protein